MVSRSETRNTILISFEKQMRNARWLMKLYSSDYIEGLSRNISKESGAESES